MGERRRCQLLYGIVGPSGGPPPPRLAWHSPPRNSAKEVEVLEEEILAVGLQQDEVPEYWSNRRSDQAFRCSQARQVHSQGFSLGESRALGATRIHRDEPKSGLPGVYREDAAS